MKKEVENQLWILDCVSSAKGSFVVYGSYVVAVLKSPQM